MIRLAPVIFPIIFTVATVAQHTANVVYYSGNQVEADIRKAPANNIGESEINLIERTPNHAAILLRRTAPGKAEVHATENDVWYVIDGGCVLMTGGTLVGAAQESPGQIRGSSIKGGKEIDLGKGDFLRIPAGVPHWIKSIRGNEIVYIVVKYSGK
ncbi:MAG TPA: hypothetical protein VH596_06880 [Terriglobales bacterium]|jgi:mannose-6-phosphate isomerase-like protein (cupin superfamily)